MKRLNHLLGVCLLLSLVVFTSCKKKDPVPEVPAIDQAVKKLSESTWTAKKVMWNDVDLVAEDGQYTNFSLQFTGDSNGGTYTATNGDPAFPKNTGTWKFEGEVSSASSFKVVRDGTVSIDVKVTSEGMNLTFIIPSESSTVRTNGAEGEIEFQLVAGS